MNTNLESKFLGGFNPFLFPLNNLNYQKKKTGIILLTNALIKLHKEKESKRLQENISNTSRNDNIEIKLKNILESMYLFTEKTEDSLEMIIEKLLIFIDELENQNNLEFNLEYVFLQIKKYLNLEQKQIIDKLIEESNTLISFIEEKIPEDDGEYDEDEDEMYGGNKVIFNNKFFKIKNKLLENLKKLNFIIKETINLKTEDLDFEEIIESIPYNLIKKIDEIKNLKHSIIKNIYGKVISGSFEDDDDDKFYLMSLIFRNLLRATDDLYVIKSEYDIDEKNDVPVDIKGKINRGDDDDSLNLDSIWYLEQILNYINEKLISNLAEIELESKKTIHLKKLGLDNSKIVTDLLFYLEDNVPNKNLDIDSETDIKDLINNKLNIILESYTDKINHISKIKTSEIDFLMSKLSRSDKNLSLFVGYYNLLRRLIEKKSNIDEKFVNNILNIMVISLINLNDSIN